MDIKRNSTGITVMCVCPVFGNRVINVFVTRLHSIGRRPFVKVHARKLRTMFRNRVTVKDTSAMVNYLFRIPSSLVLRVRQGTPSNSRFERG